MDFEPLLRELEMRYQVVNNTGDEIKHAEYKGFQDACIMMGMSPFDINKVEAKVVARSGAVSMKNDGTEEDDYLSDEDRHELEEIQAAFGENPFNFSEDGGPPTQ